MVDINNKEALDAEVGYLKFIKGEDLRIRAMLMTTFLELLAFQLDALGNIKKPPSKPPSQVMVIANRKVGEFLAEVYEENNTTTTDQPQDADRS